MLPDRPFPELLPGPFAKRSGSNELHPEWRLAIADPFIRQHDWWIADTSVPPPAPPEDPAGRLWPSGWSRWHQAERGELTITLTTMKAEPAVLAPEDLLSFTDPSSDSIYTLNVLPTPRAFLQEDPRSMRVRRLQVACEAADGSWRLILHNVEPGMFNRALIHPALARSLTLYWTDAARGQ